ncbi:replication-associated recombination protein A [Aquisalimonas lutea]|nr:replication-associated recombination protein A [Aquisalimonas lutea]MDN3518595.1 replication-associated recombination protein A [Aquisalimonas lutea]
MTADAPVRPLADRMRPRSLDEFAGQEHLLAPGKALRRSVEAGHPHSMVLWGPPGTGKTTLARLIADASGARFITLSAVMSGVKDIRAAVDEARTLREQGRPTVLFVDEAHRFNKGQQDAFLPFVEDGTLVFIGATTENPSFELNNALLSRVRTYVLRALTADALRALLQSALTDPERGLGDRQLRLEPDALEQLVDLADGDARRGLTLLEIAADLADSGVIDRAVLQEASAAGLRRFDKGGDAFYDQISALHKAVRGSDPNAALYWYCRMLDGGCDPLYVARRVVRMASEDIGNAEPRSLQMALNAWDAQERLGSPEGELAIAHAIVYLASVPKSNAVYSAFNQAMEAAREHGSLEVPLHLRNAASRLMKELGYGEEYRYAHDEPDGYAAGEDYFPEAMAPQRFYQPLSRGLEDRIRDRMERLRQKDAESRWRRRKK